MHPMRRLIVLLEAGDGALPYDVATPVENVTQATFEIGGLRYVVTLAGRFAVSVQFDSPHGQGITGTGNAFRVFSTVLAIIKDYVQARRPKSIGFAARRNLPSRVKLYDRLSRALAAQLGYRLERDDASEREVVYIMYRQLESKR